MITLRFLGAHTYPLITHSARFYRVCASRVRDTRHQGLGSEESRRDFRPPCETDILVGETVTRETVNSEIYGLSDGDKCYEEKRQGRTPECKGERGGGEASSGGLSRVESSWQKDRKGKGPEVAEGPLWLEWVTGWGGKKKER